jgi:ADP-ribosyl-[dinitrogen reductase] hydrolase
MNKKHRILGCIIAGALGDALGGRYENIKPPIKFEVARRLNLSDDTQLTLATCEAMIAKGHVDAASIADAFVKWYRCSRLTGLGASTYKAIQELNQGGHWALVGRKGEMAAGNGAAMRIAPLAFYLDLNNYHSRQILRDVCRITHHNEEAYAGALAVAISVQAAWTGLWQGGVELINLLIDHLPDSNVRDRLIEIGKLDIAIPLTEIARHYGCSGYVIESVPLAICAAARADQLSFQSVMEELISCGGDTDTNAAMAGQIIGTLIGYTNLPQHLISSLPEIADIVRTAEEFTAIILKK